MFTCTESQALATKVEVRGKVREEPGCCPFLEVTGPHCRCHARTWVRVVKSLSFTCQLFLARFEVRSHAIHVGPEWDLTQLLPTLLVGLAASFTWWSLVECGWVSARSTRWKSGPLCGGSTEFVPGMFASGSVAHPAHRADKYIPGNRRYRCGTPTSSAWWWCRRWFLTQSVWWAEGTGSSPTFREGSKAAGVRRGRRGCRQEEGPRSRVGFKRQSRQEPSAAANWRRRHESLAPLRLLSRLGRNSGIP